MKRSAIIVSVCFLVLGLGLIGCQKPVAELEKAEQALQDAKNAGAPELASADYQAAEAKLNEAKRLMDERKYKEAKNALEESRQLSELARQKAVSAKKEERAPSVGQESGKPTASSKKSEQPLPPPEPGFTNYLVVKGDCLWNIAKKAEIYGDPYQWPLIYDANKDQIKDPNLIYPNQVFKIKLHPIDEEIKSAQKRAGIGGAKKR